jgi:hypothetical protein
MLDLDTFRCDGPRRHKNQLLRIDNERLKSELKAVLGVSARDTTESDTEGQSKKKN